MQDSGRSSVTQKIRELESQQRWNEDVENDLESIELKPNKIDYLGDKFITRVFSKFANYRAISYYEKLIKNNQLIIKDIVGIENYLSVKGGAFITCNHFSPCDNYAIFRAIKPYLDKEKRNLYKVIKEGNYTNFKGLYGFFFRHCNTLPLSRNVETMKKFMKAVSVLLSRGEKILIYPEQAMWWNYKKPRPMKNGAFRFACKNNAPIIPAFITMKDSQYQDGEQNAVQAYTIFFLPPIYPKENLTEKENAEILKNENYEAWKNVYEQFYKKPLEY